jgi:hypothetical protein
MMRSVPAAGIMPVFGIVAYVVFIFILGWNGSRIRRPRDVSMPI